MQNFSFGCHIDEGNGTFVLTGGGQERKNVSRYNRNGFIGDLAQMNIGRLFHACSSFYRENKQVQYYKKKFTSKHILTLTMTSVTTGCLPQLGSRKVAVVSLL